MIEMSQDIEALLGDHCWKCHDSDTAKGDVVLDDLAGLGLEERLDLFNRIQEQVFLEHMPPKKEKNQPSEDDRGKLIAWISQDLRNHNASKLEARLRMPAYGNYVDHEKLFSGPHRV